MVGKLRPKSENSRSRSVPISKTTRPISVLKPDPWSAQNSERDWHPFQLFILILGRATPGGASRRQEAGEESDRELHPGIVISSKFWVGKTPGSPFYVTFGRGESWRRLLKPGGGGGVGSGAAPRILTQLEILSGKEPGIKFLRLLEAELQKSGLQSQIPTIALLQSREVAI
jgi:hypothetical protein